MLFPPDELRWNIFVHVKKVVRSISLQHSMRYNNWRPYYEVIMMFLWENREGKSCSIKDAQDFNRVR